MNTSQKRQRGQEVPPRSAGHLRSGLGATPPDPADLLRWGVKTVSTNATTLGGPLIIRTLSFPASPAFVALTPANPDFKTFGGVPTISGTATC